MADRQKGKAARKRPFPRRSEIYLVVLDPTVGREIRKTRPALVIQNDTSNEHLGTTILAPITSALRFPLSPAHVLIGEGAPSGLSVASMVLLDQIRTVDRARLIKKLGQVGSQTMDEADEAIMVSLGLIRL